MDPYLVPLCEGQQFSLCIEQSGVSPYLHSPYGNLYNLRGGYDTNDLNEQRLAFVKSVDKLVVCEAWWAVLSGWFVRALRMNDRKEFTLIQYIEPALWREHYSACGHERQSDEALPVCSVAWPEPTPESLSWATYALLNEQIPGSGRAILAQRNCDVLANFDLGVGVPRALELLKKHNVPEAVSALRVRGFAV